MATPSLSPYQRKLVFFLSVATFFEGYDFIALTQVLPTLRKEMNFPIYMEGYLLAFINLGTILAYFLVRKADLWGRRKLLFVTIVGYTIFTAASGLSVSPWDFAVYQFLARIFLIAEWAVTMVIAAEEFPKERRGAMIGLIQAMTTLGSIFCALLVPKLVMLRYGWRAVYLLSLLPLLLMAYARRHIKESERFVSQGSKAPDSLFGIFSTPHRKRVYQLALIWGLCYICSNNAIAFFKEHTSHDLGLSEAASGQALSIAFAVGAPLLFFVGPLLDRLGRRGASAIILPVMVLGTLGAYGLSGQWPLTFSMILAVCGIGAALPLLNAFTSELFPTELRGTGFAWSNNLLGRVSYVLSPIAIGYAADRHGYGPALMVTCIFPLIALGLILLWLPETKNKELEDTASLSH